ncbi:intraflagellar transport-associated protein [Patella vulgata]|uniref:intraflagellar transport-associated protein n=1 Tax=Patella vulgata TaxID=6465 RepID=UPI00217F3924|nr:intraflagellar transport-associated protein [Patella vulgata]XP_050408327.1 intraflagellar transport-associated protein [Patella vulgata]
MSSEEDLSPEQQNLSNSHDENIAQSLDAVLQKPEQSYDNFVSSFTYLNLDDINHKIKISEKVKNENTVVENRTDSITTMSLNTGSSPEIVKTDSDEIEEEVLDNVAVSLQSSTQSTGLSRKKLTQFDNFVSKEDSDNEDYDLDSSGYQASFIKADSSTRNNSSEAKSYLANNAQNTKCVITVGFKDDIMNSVSEYIGNEQECVYKPDQNGFMLNPGEVERELTVPDLQGVPHQRCLDYSCVVGDGTNKNNSDVAVTSTSDDVEPFVLDENFDYENVILTPKFNAIEMEYLNSIKPFTSEES